MWFKSLALCSAALLFGDVAANIVLRSPPARTGSNNIRVKPCGSGSEPGDVKMVFWNQRKSVIDFDYGYKENATVSMELLLYETDPSNVNLTVLEREITVLSKPIILNKALTKVAANYTWPDRARCRPSSAGCVLMAELNHDIPNQAPYYTCSDIRILDYRDSKEVTLFVSAGTNAAPMLPSTLRARILKYTGVGLTKSNVEVSPTEKFSADASGAFVAKLTIHDHYSIANKMGWNSDDVVAFLQTEQKSGGLDSRIGAKVTKLTVGAADIPTFPEDGGVSGASGSPFTYSPVALALCLLMLLR